MLPRPVNLLSPVAAALVACLVVAGCKSTPVDVAKGRPVEGESTYISSDFRPKDPEGLDALAPENIGKSLRKAVGLGPVEAIAQGHFAEGEKLFAAKDYDAAAKEFSRAASRWPDSILEEDALFLRAECQFFADRYSKADDTYDVLVKKYPNTRYLDKLVARQFSIARYWQEIGLAKPRLALVPNFTDRTQPLFDTWGHSINAYDNVRINDPRGALADDAVMAVANTYFLRGRYEDADYYFGLLRTEFPRSDFQLQAHLLGLQCKLRKYQGPGYNGRPIEEAEELIDQMLVQFDRELGNERERIVKAKAEVRAQRATRDIQVAQYYDKGKHYGAARIYYAQVLKDYPQTPFAEEAKTRIAGMQGQPDHPPNRLAFITDLFESEDDTRTATRDGGAMRR